MQRPLRLRHRNDFKRLREQGRSWTGAGLLLSVLPNHLPHNRYGFVVGKRLGNAVQRNRLRRRLREAMRSLDSHLQQGHDLVIVGRQGSNTKSYWDLRETLITLVRRAGLWKQ